MWRPLVVVDESHNATSELSVEMLKNLNPSFVLDLTATPRQNSNIISIVDAREMKRENMVKLPVIVYNRHTKQDVLTDAIQLRGSIEQQAKAAEANGGRYIRPIVLFQAATGRSSWRTSCRPFLATSCAMPCEHCPTASFVGIFMMN